VTVEDNGNGILVVDSSDVRIANSTAIANNNRGIFMNTVPDVVVTGTNVTLNGDRGMEFRSSPRLVVSANEVSENGQGGAPSTVLAGIYLRWCDGAQVVDNHAFLSKPGISIRESSNVLVAGNRVIDNDAPGGIDLTEVTDSRAVGNYGRNNTDGMWIGLSARLVIEDNEFEQSRTWGIAFVTTTPAPQWHHLDNIVRRNYLHDNVWGMRLYETAGTLVEDNVFVNNSFLGLDVDARDTVLQGNLLMDGTRGISFWGDTVRVRAEGNHLVNNTFGFQGNTVREVDIVRNLLEDNVHGIYMESPTNFTVESNDIFGSTGEGMYLEYADGMEIHRNVIADGNWGINVQWGDFVNVTENHVQDNDRGIRFYSVFNSQVYHNNFDNNTLLQAIQEGGLATVWDNGYPSGGNWWSDYGGPDMCSGPLQDICPDPDFIGDVPYVFTGNQDNYPFTTPSNIPPRAIFNVTPPVGTIATTFLFDANASRDFENGTTIDVRWDFEDDGVWDTGWSTTRIASHQYGALGNYTARLQVRDPGGLMDNATRTVSVVNSPPTAAFTVSPPTGNVSGIPDGPSRRRQTIASPRSGRTPSRWRCETATAASTGRRVRYSSRTRRRSPRSRPPRGPWRSRFSSTPRHRQTWRTSPRCSRSAGTMRTTEPGTRASPRQRSQCTCTPP
jgi:parallel beta-helix repeat protein